jgi:hypothetical protein
VYRNVRERTEMYGIVRERTASYEIVPNRTRTYGNVQNAFRHKPMSAKQLGLLMGVLGPSGANFGVRFPILATWETSHQHPVGAMASLAWPCTPSQRHHAPDSQIRSSKSEGNPKLQAQGPQTRKAAISDQRVGCRSFAAHALNLEIRSSKLEGNPKPKAQSSQTGKEGERLDPRSAIFGCQRSPGA